MKKKKKMLFCSFLTHLKGEKKVYQVSCFLETELFYLILINHGKISDTGIVHSFIETLREKRIQIKTITVRWGSWITFLIFWEMCLSFMRTLCLSPLCLQPYCLAYIECKNKKKRDLSGWINWSSSKYFNFLSSFDRQNFLYL